MARRFRFGYHEIQDIEQQARLIAWEGMSRYDGVRPLENFLWVHVHNRLFTFKRDNFFRPYGPCEKCTSYENKCTKYKQNDDCELYQKWKIRNVAKLNLIYPIEFSCVDDHHEHNMKDKLSTEKNVLNNELQIILNCHIPVEYRHNYLKLLYGYHISQQRKIELLSLIRDILKEYYWAE